jgi:3-dehydroquinate dehydratase / shikimate dehydrogenase
MTRLCVPITATDCQGVVRDAQAAAAAGADMLELRLDYLPGIDAPRVRSLTADVRRTGCEILATCRLAEQGGQYSGDEATRLSLFSAAVEGGAGYLDLEFDAWKRSPSLRNELAPKWRAAGARLILSQHDFQKTPDDLDAVLRLIAAEPCDVVKIACKANTIVDALHMLDALRSSSERRPTIALAMGEPGLITRVLAGKAGAFLTFASLEAGKESAPGQVSIRDMRELYRWEAVRPDTHVYGVIGCPVAHSMSPAMFNAAFTETGQNAVYLPIRVEAGCEAFAAFVDGVRARPWLGVHGVSVTIPHKENLLRYVERQGGEIEPLARRIGVANTLVLGAEAAAIGAGASGLAAFNTDYRGAMAALCASLGCTFAELGKRRVAVLGAGGAARAIVVGLRDAGCEVVIYNRTLERAQSLAAEFGCDSRPWDERATISADVVINCTSIGMWPKVDESPLPAAALDNRPAVFDTVYNPLETRLLREASGQGCRVIEGLGMLVNQAAHQFKLWTGQSAPMAVMDRMARERLSRR